MSGSSLVDKLRARLNAKNDAELSRIMEVDPPVISKLRGAGVVGPTMLIRIHECTDWPIKQIRDLVAEQPAPHQ